MSSDPAKTPSGKKRPAGQKQSAGQKRSAGQENGSKEGSVPKKKREPIGFGATELPDLDKAERLHCSGRQVPSPMGGFLESLGTRGEPDGTSTILFECKISTLRFQLPLRRSTWRERRKVRAQADEGLEPMCPRAEFGPAMVRRGKDWYCPRCNLMFGRAP